VNITHIISAANRPQPNKVRFGMMSPAAGITPDSADSVSLSHQSTTANLSPEQLKSRWQELKVTIRSKPLHEVEAIIQSIPADQLPEFLKQTEEDGQTLLHIAVAFGRRDAVEVARTILHAMPEDQRTDFLWQTDQFGWTALHCCVLWWGSTYRGRLGAVKTLIELIPKDQRLDFIQQQGKNGETALQRLAHHSHHSALHPGSVYPNEALVGLLLSYGDNANELTPAQMKEVIDDTLDRRNQAVNALVNPSATPGNIRSQIQWLQFFPPNGGVLNWDQAHEVKRAEQEAISQSPTAEREDQAAARRWLQTYQDWTVAGTCNAFLASKLDELTPLGNDMAGKDAKEAILKRL
jgi:hypothetical protein